MPDRYAVFGNPVAHSKSPLIHAAFARQTGQDIEYVAQKVEPGTFAHACDQFFSTGGKGLNVTVPFKLEACDYAAQLTERARRAGAVNTLVLLDDGSVLGDTTDGVGMVRDMSHNHGWQITAKRVLVLGAGGAVRGILEPILGEHPASLVIANRTAEKAEKLAADFAGFGTVAGIGIEQLRGQFDVVINGTSASLAGDLPPLPHDLLAPHACCYDMMYGPEPTVFMNWAKDHGSSEVADGLGMLVEQAAESFTIWRGIRPATIGVIEDIRKELHARR